MKWSLFHYQSIAKIKYILISLSSVEHSDSNYHSITKNLNKNFRCEFANLWKRRIRELKEERSCPDAYNLLNLSQYFLNFSETYAGYYGVLRLYYIPYFSIAKGVFEFPISREY